MRFLYALRFLTVLPIPWRQDEDLKKVARSAAFFPAVGLVLGLLLWLSVAAGQLLLSSPHTLAVVPVLLWVLATGGLHLDGAADLADGLGGGRTPEKRLAIMKDSRIGTFGALTLIALLALKWALTAELLSEGTALFVAPLVAAPLFGRWLQTALIATFPSARPDGIGAFFKQRLRPSDLAAATAMTLGGLWLCLGLYGLIAAAGSAVILTAAVPVSKKLGGGLTGDVYGSFTEWGEALYLGLALALLHFLPPWHWLLPIWFGLTPWP